MRNLLLLAILYLMANLVACTDSDDFFYDESETQFIEVEAFAARSFNDITMKSKIDTVDMQDSLILIAEVYPSKTIRNQKIFWDVNGNRESNEFSFKWFASKPGLTKAAFVFVDYFGDTLSDTVSIYVSTPPILNDDNFLPLDKSQNISSNQPVHFAWDSRDPDEMWELNNHFVLQEWTSRKVLIEDPIADTIVHQNYISIQQGLKPLTRYSWSVEVSNSMEQSAEKKLTGSFYTSGSKGENAILVSLSTSSKKTTQSCQITVEKIENDTTIHYQDLSVSLTPEQTEFYVRPLPAGKFRVIASSNSYADYSPDTLTVQLQGDQVVMLDTLVLVDKIPPRIKSEQSADTIEFTAKPKFVITDEGGNILTNSVKVRLDGTLISETTFARDTLTIELPIQNSWTYRLLTIYAEDASENKTSKQFYIKPNTSLAEIF